MAKSRALTIARKTEEKRVKAASRARAIAKQAALQQQHTLIAGAATFGLGFAESKGVKLPTVDGVDPKALYTAVAFAASMLIKDRKFKQMLDGVTDGLIAITAYQAGSRGFNSLMSYSPPATSTAGYGEEIIETGEF